MKKWIMIIVDLVLLAAIVISWILFMDGKLFSRKVPVVENEGSVSQSVQEETPKPELPLETVVVPEETPEPEIVMPQEEEQTEEPEVSEETESAAEENDLQGKLESFSRENDGDWSILVETLDGTVRAGVNENEEMVSASLIKLFVMAAAFEQIEAGLLDRETAVAHMEPMIAVSDNDSTNRLIKLLGEGDDQKGMEAVNSYAEKLGCSQTRLNRLMLANNGLQNYTSAADCCLLLKKIGNLECVSEEASREMLEILKGQTIRTRIPAGLPSGVECGNKTGDLIGICCADVGIVLADEASYVICLICNRQSNDVLTTVAMAKLSETVYGWIVNGEE